MEHQRKVLPYSEDAILIEGILHSAHTPEELRGPLPMAPMGAGEAELRRHEQPFNQRARYRLRRHAGPDADGVTRWKCPFHAGALRSRELPWTMRGPRSAPLVELPEDTRCCSGIRSVPPADLPHWQRISPGTTAWRRSMGRRQRAEGANAGLKGGYVDITRKHIRVLGRTKMMFLLSFTIAGYNRDRIRAFLKKTAHEATAPKTRAKRRRGTYKDILGVSVGGSGRDPPAAATTGPD